MSDKWQLCSRVSSEALSTLGVFGKEVVGKKGGPLRLTLPNTCLESR